MGYIYEMLKNVLSGNRRGDASDWAGSPNMFRSIVVTPEFIFTARFIGNPRVVRLDAEKVRADLADYKMGKGKGALHNLLAERQLSCLEEIYFDVVFEPYQNLYDIEYYINKVKSSVSRLRYYGYCVIPNGQYMTVCSWLDSTYKNANVLYSITEDKTKPFMINYKSTGTKEWYRNYNLRPNFYKADADDGDLAIYFRKNEKIIDKYLKDMVDKEKNTKENEVILTACLSDLRDKDYILMINKLYNYTVNFRKGDEFLDLCNKCLLTIVRINKEIPGITRDRVVDVMSIDGRFPDYMVKSLDSMYDLYQIYDKKKGTLDLEKLEKRRMLGLLNIRSIFDMLCLTLSDAICKNKKMIQLVQYNCMDVVDTVPMGPFRNKYFQGKGKPSNGGMEGYVTYLSNVLGVDLHNIPVK